MITLILNIIFHKLSSRSRKKSQTKTKSSCAQTLLSILGTYSIFTQRTCTCAIFNYKPDSLLVDHDITIRIFDHHKKEANKNSKQFHSNVTCYIRAISSKLFPFCINFIRLNMILFYTKVIHATAEAQFSSSFVRNLTMTFYMLWCVSRGINLGNIQKYKMFLHFCRMPVVDTCTEFMKSVF